MAKMTKISLTLSEDALTRLDGICTHNHRSRPQQIARWIYATLSGELVETPVYPTGYDWVPPEAMSFEDVIRAQHDSTCYLRLDADGVIRDEDGEACGEMSPEDVNRSQIASAAADARRQEENSPMTRLCSNLLERARTEGAEVVRTTQIGGVTRHLVHMELADGTPFVWNVSNAGLFALLVRAYCISIEADDYVDQREHMRGRTQLDPALLDPKRTRIPWSPAAS